MTNLELLKENSFFLLQPVEEKPYDNSFSSKKIGYQLLDFMYLNDGIGLSANQVGFNHRIFVMGNKDTQCICWNPHILEYYQFVLVLLDQYFDYDTQIKIQLKLE